MEKRVQSLITDWHTLPCKTKEIHIHRLSSNINQSMQQLREDFHSQLIQTKDQSTQGLDIALNFIDMLISVSLHQNKAKIKQNKENNLAAQTPSSQQVQLIQELLKEQAQVMKENQKSLIQIEKLLEQKPQIEALFFPSEVNKYKVMKELLKAKKEIKIAMFYFTDQFYLNVLKKLSRKDVVIKIIYTEMNDLEIKTSGTRIKTKKIPVRPLSKKFSNFMHHKFVVIDQQTVLTGSLNWTRMSHNENIVIIKKCPQIAEAFSDEFNKLFE